MPAARSIRLRYLGRFANRPYAGGFFHRRRPSHAPAVGDEPQPYIGHWERGPALRGTPMPAARSIRLRYLGRIANRPYAGGFPFAGAPSPAPAVGDEPQPYRTMPEVIPPSMAGLSGAGRGEM